MLIGICSDSHNHAAPLRSAIAMFDRLGARTIVHCGDVGGQEAFDELVGRDVHFVWGNTDVPRPGLRAYLRTVGIAEPDAVPLVREWAGKKIAVFHGHESGFRRAPAALDVDYIFCGHSHMRCDERAGSVRIINPGALHRAQPKTVATLDLATDTLQFHEIDGAG